jgi:hypothetical protein
VLLNKDDVIVTSWHGINNVSLSWGYTINTKYRSSFYVQWLRLTENKEPFEKKKNNKNVGFVTGPVFQLLYFRYMFSLIRVRHSRRVSPQRFDHDGDSYVEVKVKFTAVNESTFLFVEGCYAACSMT